MESATYRKATLGNVIETRTKKDIVELGFTSINAKVPGVLIGFEET